VKTRCIEKGTSFPSMTLRVPCEITSLKLGIFIFINPSINVLFYNNLVILLEGLSDCEELVEITLRR
jgi:hypothetical protein